MNQQKEKLIPYKRWIRDRIIVENDIDQYYKLIQVECCLPIGDQLTVDDFVYLERLVEEKRQSFLN